MVGCSRQLGEQTVNNCITIGMDLGDKKHAVVGLDEKVSIAELNASEARV